MSTQKTTIDWLRFRVQAEPREVFEALKPSFPKHSSMMNFKHLGRGMMGFQQAANICADDFVMGRMDFGGESQRGWVRVDIPAKGCEWMQFDDLSILEQLPDCQIRRLDVALTTWDSEVGHDMVVKAHQEGRFITRGRPPVLTQITSSSERAGRTCYIGQREKSDKFARCYEKGYELAAKMPMFGSKVTHIEGHPIEGIYRCEMEFKAVKSDIPWDVVKRRDQYFAGSYPFFGDVLPNVDSDILHRRPERGIQADLALALENARIQYGPTLYTALRAYRGDIGAVWEKIVGDHHSQPLIEAGVLLVEHD
jgi:phage replication initiation protein